MADAPELDHAETRALARFVNGEPPTYEGHVLYQHQWDEDSGQFVLVPLRFRSCQPVSFKGMSVARPERP